MLDPFMYMKYLIKILSVTFILLLTMSMLCCEFDESRNHLSGGQLLDDEKMSQIRNEVLSGELSETDSDEITSEKDIAQDETDENNDNSDSIVFWTEGGSVWHISPTCSHIKNSSKKIFAGTTNDAVKAGKTKQCASCSD